MQRLPYKSLGLFRSGSYPVVLGFWADAMFGGPFQWGASKRSGSRAVVRPTATLSKYIPKSMTLEIANVFPVGAILIGQLATDPIPTETTTGSKIRIGGGQFMLFSIRQESIATCQQSSNR